MKKLFLFMSWVMLILSGCADEDIIERNSPSFPQSVNTRSAGDGVYDILGYGYDITGPYLDTKSSRAIVFDTNKLLEKGLITPYKLEESRFRYSSGKDVIDFTTNMSSSLQMSTPGILKVIGGASLNISLEYIILSSTNLFCPYNNGGSIINMKNSFNLIVIS